PPPPPPSSTLFPYTTLFRSSPPSCNQRARCPLAPQPRWLCYVRRELPQPRRRSFLFRLTARDLTQVHAAASHRRWQRDFRRSVVCLRKRSSLRLRKNKAPGLRG